ncbi:MAG: glycosyltransferase family 2 protein [Bacteroidales bacterium]|nr:glycosyltransferase family 2 protein [Bacteroidales bacterium]
MRIIFWILVFIVFYTYIGYGILVWLLVKIKEHGKSHDSLSSHSMDIPEVTILIAAYNEEAVAADKMDNCMALDYPADKLNVLWATDGCTDNTVPLLTKYINDHKLQNVKIQAFDERKGKGATLRRGIEHVKTPIVVFTDANTMINKKAIREIVKKFDNPKVGCVSGEKRVGNAEKENSIEHNRVKDAVETEGIYWKYESFLKDLDSRLCSAMGADGGLFALRRELFETLPEGVLLDDFIISMRILLKGYLIAYCPEAYVHEGTSASIAEESKRKVRIAAGGIQSVGMLKPLLNIFKYGILSFEYISHRVLRWTITPFALLLLLPLNIIIIAVNGWNPLIYPIVFVLQLLFYDLALYGAILSRQGKKSKIPYVCYYFMFMNICVFKGIAYLRRKSGEGTWEKAKRA